MSESEDRIEQGRVRAGLDAKTAAQLGADTGQSVHIIHQLPERRMGHTWSLSSCKGQNNAQMCLSWSARCCQG